MLMKEIVNDAKYHADCTEDEDADEWQQHCLFPVSLAAGFWLWLFKGKISAVSRRETMCYVHDDGVKLRLGSYSYQ